MVEKSPDAIKVLLVDDEPDVLDFLGYRLRREGFRLLTASGGKDAIRKAIRERPDLVILDIMMPECDGIRVCHRLRRSARTRGAVILLHTAGSLPFARHATELSGADGFLRKPLRPTDFLHHIKGQLARFGLTATEQRSLLVSDDVVMNRISLEITIAERCVRLKSEEFDLLWLLVASRGTVVSYDVLQRELGYDFGNAAHRLKRTIQRLQEKIGRPYIQPVSSSGYRFERGKTA